MDAVVKGPLGVILCRHQADHSLAPFLEAAEAVLTGEDGVENYYVRSQQALPVPVRRFVDLDPPDIPVAHLLDGTMHTLVSVLVDTEMLRAESPWRSWLGECIEAVEMRPGCHRMVLTLASSALLGELDEFKVSERSRIETVIVSGEIPDGQTIRFSEHAENPAWHALHLLHSCRTLLAEVVFPEGLRAEKLDFFLSHAKKDAIPLVKSIKGMIQSQPCLRAWYDAERLAGVPDWRAEIREGALSSVMIVLRTNAYETRPWCRREYLWAVEHSIPMITVDARTGQFQPPDELTNPSSPTVSLRDGNFFRLLFPAMAESLKRICLLRIGRALKERSSTGDCPLAALPVKPRSIHILGAAENLGTSHDGSQAILLYPDPPLAGLQRKSAEWAVEGAIKGGGRMLTPHTVLLEGWEARTRESMSNAMKRSVISISISEHLADLQSRGYHVKDMNDMVVRLAKTLVANHFGCSFGHDWRNDGVMMAILKFAEEHDEIVLGPDDRQPIITNYRCAEYGERSTLEQDGQIQRMEGVLRIVTCEDPVRLRREGARPDYWRARALTDMRRRITQESAARICVGGRDMDPNKPEAGPSGRLPGIVEEAFLSILLGKPLFISKVLGGVSEWVVEALHGAPTRPLAFEPSKTLSEAYPVEYPCTWDAYASSSGDAYPVPAKVLTELLGGKGVLDSVAKCNGLSVSENEQLFEAQTLDEVINWTLLGLGRLRKKGAVRSSGNE